MTSELLYNKWKLSKLKQERKKNEKKMLVIYIGNFQDNVSQPNICVIGVPEKEA